MNILFACLQAGTLVALIRMIWTDFTTRRIETLWLAAFGVLLGAFATAQYGWRYVGFNLLTNFIFLAFYYFFIWGYILILKRRAACKSDLSNGTDFPHKLFMLNYIGAGDLLFLPALAIYFPLREFVFFLVLSFLLSLAGWSLYALLTRRIHTVPLVGTVGIVFIVYSVFKLF